MKKFWVVFGFVCLGIMSSMAQQAEHKISEKEAKALAAYEKMKTLVASNAFSFQADRASIPGNSNIRLFHIPNYLKIEAETVDMYLPYFGVLQLAGSANDGGMEYRGAVQKYKVTYDDKNQKIKISFQIKKPSDLLDVDMIIRKRRTSVTILSARRTTIQYDGKLEAMEATTDLE